MRLDLENDEISKVPSGILTCLIDDVEVGVIGVSGKSIAVRTAEPLEHNPRVDIKGYVYSHNMYKSWNAEYKDMELVQQDEAAYVYRIHFTEHCQLIQDVLVDYNKYIIMKSNSIGNEFSKDMTGYPEELDDYYYGSYEEQVDQLSPLSLQGIVEMLDKKNVELAVSIDNPIAYAAYLSRSDKEYLTEYMTRNRVNIGKANGKCNEEACVNHISRLYIGSQFCDNLMCETDMLLRICDKASDNNKKITLCYAYIKENNVDKLLSQLEKVHNWCEMRHINIEIVFNDYGFLEIFRRNPHFKEYMTLCAGILVNKMRKDPRFQYKNGADIQEMMETSLYSEDFSKELSKLGVSRYEYESCGPGIRFQKSMKSSISIPFYQTNTSNYCPLRAVVKTGERGRQEDCENCSHDCLKYVLMYPSHLNVFGIYNSIMAVDTDVLRNNRVLADYVGQGVDRVVLNYYNPL